MTTPRGMTPPRPEPTHPCVRCGAPVPPEVGLCERCNPLGLKDSASSQVHGTAFVAVALAIVFLAVAGRLAVAGVGPFPATLTSLGAEGDGLAVTLSVRNEGTSAGQTTCRLYDPAQRGGGRSAFLLSPEIGPGETVTFSKRVTELGPTLRDLAVECTGP
jgi:hypothetical protein